MSEHSKNRYCPVCGGKRSKTIHKVIMKVPEDYHLPDSYHVAVCEDCGMVYSDTKAGMEDYDWYYSHCNFYGDDSKCDNSLSYDTLEEFLTAYCRKDSSILNIGSGNGRFEVALKKNGYTFVTGMDPSGESVERLKKAGIRSYIGNIYQPVLEEEETYDFITLIGVIEHLLDPGKGILNVRRLLKGDGTFVVNIPDYSVLGKHTKEIIPHHFNLEHINYFSGISLDNLLNRYGMQSVAEKRVKDELFRCYKKAGVSNEVRKDDITWRAVDEYFGTQRGKEERISQIIAGLIGDQREIIIWGTGAFVMNLIATTDLGKCRIKGFIDNNKIKQGRELYGRTIYAPEFLQDKKYTVLICSILNSEEIREQLERMNTENDYIVL